MDHFRPLFDAVHESRTDEFHLECMKERKSAELQKLEAEHLMLCLKVEAFINDLEEREDFKQNFEILRNMQLCETFKMWQSIAEVFSMYLRRNNCKKVA